MRRSCVLTCLTVAAVWVAALPARAAADRATTTEALARLDETLSPQLSEGTLGQQEIFPILLVSALPAYEETKASYPALALSALAAIFEVKNIRACEACMNPRVDVVGDRLEMSTGGMTIPEIVAFDVRTRGRAGAAKAAIWIDETRTGVAVRIVSLKNGQILFAANLDGELREFARSKRNFTFSDEVGRRLRGESLTHIFLDAGLVPGQHISMDVVEQFGDDNKNLAGITMSAIDPIIGFGAVYYRVIPFFVSEPFPLSMALGAQVVMSVPTALASALTQSGSTQLFDPIVVGVLVLRVPVPYTSFAALMTLSTKGTVAIGVTLMNFALFPVLP